MNTEQNSNCSLAHVHKEYTHYAWYKYALGFKRAAITLIDQVMTDEDQRDVPNELLYPILFCFRHFVELLLKQLIADYNELMGRVNKIPDKHDIKHLYQKVIPIIDDIIFDRLNNPKSKFKSTFTKNDTKNLKEVISVLDQYDPNGESFRYPIDRKGRATLKGSFHVPLVQLKEKIEESFDILNHISFMMIFAKKMNPAQSEAAISVEKVN